MKNIFSLYSCVSVLSYCLIAFLCGLIVSLIYLFFGGVKYFISENDYHSLVVITFIVSASIVMLLCAEYDKRKNGDVPFKDEIL